ncbi:hypothetical protein RFI_12711 [Reticulomyxa filosa]|uniref:Uncharacterized protein n=1 Tax=Reticulomyxa filosa TaxID=46433 RepID=X6NFD6_RETFI|nr:hypothetical protein RFI_12711 [Reticulomyxa filosa]|eukprot:ETO24444.1 hypothetical protein RFI_12711 [Reticulomyxa filosa]
MVKELKEKEEYRGLDEEQVRSVFLVMQVFPDIRQQLIGDPSFILAPEFQKKADQLQINSSSIPLQTFRIHSFSPETRGDDAEPIVSQPDRQTEDEAAGERRDSESSLLRNAPPPTIEHETSPNPPLPVQEGSLVVVTPDTETNEMDNDDNNREKEGDPNQHRESESKSEIIAEGKNTETT